MAKRQIRFEELKVIRIPQPEDSWEDNPCWDCCFGVNGECNAPQEIIDSDEECGFSWSMPNYVYKRIED